MSSKPTTFGATIAAARETFLKRAKAHAAAAGIKLSTLSLYLMNDGKGLSRIDEGGDIGTRQLERAEAILAKREADQAKAKPKPAAKTRR